MTIICRMMILSARTGYNDLDLEQQDGPLRRHLFLGATDGMLDRLEVLGVVESISKLYSQQRGGWERGRKTFGEHGHIDEDRRS